MPKFPHEERRLDERPARRLAWSPGSPDDADWLERTWRVAISIACNVAYRIVRDPGLANDVAVDTAMALVTRIRDERCRFEAKGPFVKWIHTTAKRRALNVLRARDRLKGMDTDELVAPENGRSAWILAVRACLNKLPELQRVLLLLYYDVGMTDSQLGRLYGRNNQWFRRTRRLPALAALTKLLLEEGIEPEGSIAPPFPPPDDELDDSDGSETAP